MVLQFAAAVLVSVMGNAVVAGDSAAIHGVVTDEEGKPLAGATIIVLPYKEQQFATNSDGSFLVSGLSPGRYTVIVLGPPLVGGAYTPRVKHDLRLDPQQTASLKVQLTSTTRSLAVYYDSPTDEDLSRYTSVLSEMDEPGLCEAATLPDKAESYRFLWLRSFHNAVLIRLFLQDTGAASLQYKELARHEDSEIPQLTENRLVDVNSLLLETLEDDELVEAVLDQFKKKTESNFWNLSYHVDDDTIGVDGATWIIEGTKDGRCHVVNRWSPEETDGFRQLAEDLMRFSGKRFYYDEVY